MDKDEAIRDLMAKLMQAVETSLSTSAAVRDALAELVRNGYEARLFFVANAESADTRESDEDGDGEPNESAEAPEATAAEEDATYMVREIGAAPDPTELRFELTRLDRDFLKSLHIRPESG
ncbi:MAG TPA: hypothetical protein VGW35_18725 [Methylomirabilota bacterium]|jgi:hypothetical protein|nr:hypothetical protein [Methylomirabilota bacterium]